MFNYKLDRLTDVTEEERMEIWKNHVSDKHSNVVRIAVKGIYDSICKIENVAHILVYLGKVDDEDYHKFENFESDFIYLTDELSDTIVDENGDRVDPGCTYDIDITYKYDEIPEGYKVIYENGVWYE